MELSFLIIKECDHVSSTAQMIMHSISGTLSGQKKQSKKYQASEPGVAGWSKIELRKRNTKEMLPANAEEFAVCGHCLEDPEYLDGESIVLMLCPQELCVIKEIASLSCWQLWGKLYVEVSSLLTVMWVCVFIYIQK